MNYVKKLKFVVFNIAKVSTQISVISRLCIEALSAVDFDGRLICEWFVKLEFTIGRNARHEVIYPCRI